VRPVLALALALALVPLLPAAAGLDGPTVVMTIDVQPDHTERLALEFSQLQRLARYTDLCLPLGADVTSVKDSLGDAPYDKGVDAAGRETVSFTARETSIAIRMTRAQAAPPTSAPFYEGNANFCVPADSALTVKVTVPQEHTLYFLNHNGQLAPDGRSGRIDTSGPVHAFYAYEGALPAGAALVEEGPFRIVAPADQAPQAREVARDAAPALRAALDLAAARIEAFHRAQLPRDLETRENLLRKLVLKFTGLTITTTFHDFDGKIEIKPPI